MIEDIDARGRFERMRADFYCMYARWLIEGYGQNLRIVAKTLGLPVFVFDGEIGDWEHGAGAGAELYFISYLHIN